MKDVLEIFYVFAKIGTLTFGGGYAMLPLLHKYISDKYDDWVTQTEITDYFATAHCLPGIIAVNTAMFIGHKRKGFAGMIAGALGVIMPAVAVIFVIAIFLENLMQFDVVNHALRGVYVAVLVLIIGAVIKMWKTGIKDIFGILIFAVSLAVFTVFSVLPVWPIIAGAMCGILIKEAKERVR